MSKALDLFQGEGCALIASPFSLSDYIVINGDQLEAESTLAAGKTVFQKSKSVDLIFGVESVDGNVKEFQFVELKLRTKNFFHLDKFSFRDKVNSSTIALGTSEKISSKYYIVFKKEILNQAERFLFRINPKLNNDFKAIDPEGLHALFF
ncbi:hypothetical protein [Flavobacterium selenitireducens]|uniref:hypothetical protein n=1 Tax=Flavobacterium selenitireducens TaxID=2722704 RepID=UPI00168B929A|nr:hypothetical protein [Flavobacterium selenitireducens]MBD3583910.1 hypothetical protein [Flavobacterium selenitireducens]